jgi:hypothetical protein
MQIRADVKCYFCGHVSGQIEGDPDRAEALWHYRTTTGAVASVRHGAKRIRCDRCRGPVFLDEIETVRFPQPLPSRRVPAAALAVSMG